MRNLIIALTVVATPVMADSYLVSIDNADMARLTLDHNLPLPKNASVEGNLTWGTIAVDGKHTSTYLDKAQTIVVLSKDTERHYRAKCGRAIAPACVQTILAEEGHD